MLGKHAATLAFLSQYRIPMRASTALFFIIWIFSISVYAAVDILQSRDFLEESNTSTAIHFATPNEDEFYLFNHVLEQRVGVLMAVGTFRAFHDASVGRFSDVILFDFTRAVNDLNRRHIEIIRASSDRHDYLRRLFSDSQIPGDYLRKMQQYLASERSQLTFLGSDEAFARLKKLVDSGRVFSISGSLSGPKAIAWLASELKRLGQTISVLDISNVLDAIKSGGETQYFLANLKALPFSENARILFTVQNLGHGGWAYQSFPYNDYIQQLEHNLTRNIATPRQTAWGLASWRNRDCNGMLK